MSTVITSEIDFKELLETFKTSAYSAGYDDKDESIINRCHALFKLDYSVVEVPNPGGDLSPNYPNRLIIPEFEKRHFQNTSEVIHENKLDSMALRTIMLQSRLARCRCRFPVPVIVYKGKFLCRSSTISTNYEILFNYYTSKSSSREQSAEYNPDNGKALDKEKLAEKESFFNSIRQADVKLLKTYRVDTIFDYMVEMHKIKYYLSVSSSEKADKDNRYVDFNVVSLPYPGCEFFLQFHNNGYTAENLMFDWTQSFIDASLTIPKEYKLASQLPVEWPEYKNWDLIRMTQNYVKLVLKHLQDGNSGLLIHCISGWDRTPLFVSLIRLLLWADGVAHQSLSTVQVLYLTIAYDWYLFGHHLPDRIHKGEDIFFFCFYFLKHLMSDEFSIISHRSKPKNNSSGSSVGYIIPGFPDGDFDGVMIGGNDGGDGRGSNWSINSVGSRLSTGSHEDNIQMVGNSNSILQNDESNGNSNSSDTEVLGTSVSEAQNIPLGSAKTTPLSVPLKIDVESGSASSSLQTGSWAVVSATGSLNSTAEFPLNRGSGSDGKHDDEFITSSDQQTATPSTRQSRLKALRSQFYTMYCTYVGVGANFKNGIAHDPSLGALLGGLADRFGGLIK